MIMTCKDKYGNDINIEVEDDGNDSPEVDCGGEQGIAVCKFENVFSNMKPTLIGICDQVKEALSDCSEIEVELGFKVNGEAGFVLAKASTEGSIKIKARWKNE